jgi:hypothetical protein
MVLHLNRECMTLQGPLNKYCSTTTTNLNHEEKLEFVEKVSPTIKKAMFNIFLCLTFPVCWRLQNQRIAMLSSVLG